MTPHEEQQIIRWNRDIVDRIQITISRTKDKRNQSFQMFCNQLSTLASNVEVYEKVDVCSEYPSIEITDNIRYYAIPEGLQLEPFLKALSPDNCYDIVSEAIRNRISCLDDSVEFSLFVSAHCPHCPSSVRQLIELSRSSRMVKVNIIDTGLFPELARNHDLECVPTTFWGYEFKWSGVTPLEDIVEVVTNRNPSDFSSAAIERILEERNALKAAKIMLDAGHIHPSLFDFMVDERFFLRLGAMTAIEEIIRKDSVMASQIVEPLWARFGQAIEPIQIDILYLLGDAGNTDTISLLESVINGDFRDHVKETACEAIESIKERYS